MDKKSLIHDLDVYLNYISMANDYYSAYLSLIDSITTEKDKINLAPGFFQITRHALVLSLMMMLSTLYDNSDTDKTLKALIKQCSVYAKASIDINNSDRVMQMIERTQGSFTQMGGKQLKVLRSRRNKIYAHNDKEFFGKPEKMLEELWISKEEVEELLTVASEFCCGMINELDDRIVFPFSINNDDLKNLLVHVSINK